MKKINEPWWIFLVNTLPLLLFLVIMMGQFSVVKSLISPEQLGVWRWFAISLIAMMVFSALYAGWLLFRRKKMNVVMAVASLLLWITWIYIYGANLERLIPADVPAWMLSEQVLLYAGTFLMPTLAYNLFFLIVRLTVEPKNSAAWINFLFAVLIPVFGYIFVQGLLPYWQPTESRFTIHIFVIVVIAVTLVFFFLLLRGLYIVAVRNAERWKEYHLIWKIPVAVIMPVVGLLLNNGFIFQRALAHAEGIFGDFSHPLFYVIALLNGVVLCLPALERPLYRLALFLARVVTFAFTTYFMIVFLPYLPLSLVAIVAFGTGVLMLTPALLFLIHINELIRDIRYLGMHYRIAGLRFAAIAGFFIIPSIVTLSYIHDRHTLHKALNYIYSSGYVNESELPDENRLRNVFQNIRSQKSRNQIIMTKHIPYLTAWYNRVVLDNLTVSGSKLNLMERVFFGNGVQIEDNEFRMNRGVVLTGLKVSGSYNENEQIYQSHLDLEITNTNTGNFFEYFTEFELPEGCFISDYDLVVEGFRKQALLAEKRSALWVFSMIRQVRRDPGILWYRSGRRVGFQIYPFTGGEVRQTGISFIHREPVTITLDGRQVLLGDTMNSFEKVDSGLPEGVAYVSASHKSGLPVKTRTPYFHFFVDISADAEENSEKYPEMIEDLLTTYPQYRKGSKISFVNATIRTVELSGDWAKELSSYGFKGGFYLDRGIRQMLVQSYLRQSDSVPIPVVLTGSFTNAVIRGDFADLRFAIPDHDYLYTVTGEGELLAHLLSSNPASPVDSIAGIRPGRDVLVFKEKNGRKTYLPDNDLADIVLNDKDFNPESGDEQLGIWERAMYQEGLWRMMVLHPELENRYWQSLVRNSFESGIMSPMTSYIVLENEAQEAALLRKQKQVLQGKYQLDTVDDSVSMSEPGLLIPLILLAALLGFRLRKTGFGI